MNELRSPIILGSVALYMGFCIVVGVWQCGGGIAKGHLMKADPFPQGYRQQGGPERIYNLGLQIQEFK